MPWLINIRQVREPFDVDWRRRPQAFVLTTIKGKSSDVVLGFHCFSIDVIMAFCFAKNLDTTKVPDFQSEIILASHAVLPILTVGKYSTILLKMMRRTPVWFGKKYGSSVTKAWFSLLAVRKSP